MLELYDVLKANGVSYGKRDVLASLGVLAMTDLSIEEILQEIAEVDDYLRNQKGFGFWGTGDTVRRMYAALLVIYAQGLNETNMHAALLGSVLTTRIAQQTAMMAIYMESFNH